MPLADRLLAAAFHRNRWELLAAGTLLLVLARGWPAFDVLSWFVPIPWLHFLRHNPRWVQRLHLGLAWIVAWVVVFALSPRAGPGLAATLTPAITTLAALLAWGAAERRMAPNEGLIAFGLLMAAASVATTALGLPDAARAMASTGVAPLERLATVVGAPAMAFLVHWTAATIEGQWDTVYPASMQHHGCALIVVLVLALVAGAICNGVPSAFALAGVQASASAIAGALALLVLLQVQRRDAWRRMRAKAPIDPW